MKKILVVDDASFMRQTIISYLKKHDFQVVGEAPNGVIAVEKCKELEPDLITLDITMPELDGLGALKEIRSFNKDTKIIIVSAMGQEDKVREAIRLGADNFIVKPFKEDVFIAVLQKLL
jgi:two-component system chemotaxis response regulator CheY